jgi:hypothetical protein
MSEETQQIEGQEATPVKVRRKKLPLRPLKVMTVDVRQENVDTAIRGKSTKCMIVQAIERAYPTLTRIVVQKNDVRVTDPDRNVIYTFDMAPLARAAILKWDMGEQVEPFAFKLRHPIIRTRMKKQHTGHMGTAGNKPATRHLGVLRHPKTAESRAMMGRDRVFGAKLWTSELEKLRRLVGVPATA